MPFVAKMPLRVPRGRPKAVRSQGRWKRIPSRRRGGFNTFPHCFFSGVRPVSLTAVSLPFLLDFPFSFSSSFPLPFSLFLICGECLVSRCGLLVIRGRLLRWTRKATGGGSSIDDGRGDWNLTTQSRHVYCPCEEGAHRLQSHSPVVRVFYFRV